MVDVSIPKRPSCPHLYNSTPASEPPTSSRALPVLPRGIHYLGRHQLRRNCIEQGGIQQRRRSRPNPPYPLVYLLVSTTPPNHSGRRKLTRHIPPHNSTGKAPGWIHRRARISRHRAARRKGNDADRHAHQHVAVARTKQERRARIEADVKGEEQHAEADGSFVEGRLARREGCAVEEAAAAFEAV